MVMPGEPELSNFFDLSLDLLCITDSKGFLRRVNPAFENTLGFTLEELTSRPVLDFVHPDDIEKTLAESERLALGEPVHFENRYRTKKAGYKWVSWSLSPAPGGFLYAIGRDVTEEKEHEQQLKDLVKNIEIAENSRQRAFERQKLTDVHIGVVLNAATEGFLLVDADRQILWANPAIRRMFGLQSVDLIGQYSSVLEPALKKTIVNPEKFFERLREIYDDNTCVVEDEIVETVALDQMTLSRTSVPVISPENEYIGRLWIYRDVTRARAADRAKSEFVSVVSHELRTPLTSIQGALALLASGTVAGGYEEEGSKLLQIADENTRRLVRLINDILDLEKIESGNISLKFQRCDVRDLIGTAIEHAGSAEPSENIEIKNLVDSIDISVDHDRLIQVFVNLIGNAVKYSAPGDSVEVSAAQHDGSIEFTVADAGPGIPRERLESVFNPFEQVDSSDTRIEGGTGLGLAICKSIVEQHGGQIWVDSVPGQGSKFRFSIPQAIAPKPSPVKHEARNRVLVVEDDGSLGHIIEQSFRTIGVEAIVVANAVDAIAQFLGSPPQVMIVDIGLPGMDGIEMLQGLRELCRRANTRVILYTARETVREQSSDVDPIVDAVLLKSKTSVAELVEQVLRLISETDGTEGAA